MGSQGWLVGGSLVSRGHRRRGVDRVRVRVDVRVDADVRVDVRVRVDGGVWVG